MDDVSGTEFREVSRKYVATLAIALIHAGKLSVADLLLAKRVSGYVLEEPPRDFIEPVARLLAWSLEQGVASEANAVRFLLHACETYLTPREISILVDIQNVLDPGRPQRIHITRKLQAAAVEYLSNNINNEVSDSDVFDDVDEGDTDGALHNLESLIQEWLEKLGVECSARDMSTLTDQYDVEEREKEYREELTQERSFDLPRPVASAPSVDVIDDLFDRS